MKDPESGLLELTNTRASNKIPGSKENVNFRKLDNLPTFTEVSEKVRTVRKRPLDPEDTG